MKRIIKYILLTILCLGLTNCSNTEKTNEDPEIYYLPITYTITTSENWQETEYFKHVNGCEKFYISNEDTNNKAVEINYSDYGVNFDSLIGGDVLKLTYYGEYRNTDKLPGTIYLNAKLESIEIIKADIYEVIVHNNGESVTFTFKDNNVNIDETILNNEFLYYNSNGMAFKVTTSSLEDGTVLYYSYNKEHVVEHPNGTCLHNYNPRGE